MNKHRPWLYILGAIALIGALGLSALGGAAITYLITRPTPVRAAIDLVQERGNADMGLLIARVADDSPAAAAGLTRGDILLRVDDTEVNTLADLQDVLAEREPGDAVVVTVLHGDETRALEVTLGAADDRAYLGITPCTCDAHDDLGVPGPAWRFRDPESAAPLRELLGAEITEIVPDSPAAEAELAVGDIIVSVDGEDVGPGTDLAALIRAHQPGDTVVLGVVSHAEDEPHDVTVTLAEHPDAPDQAYLGVRYAPAISLGEGHRWVLPFLDEEGSLPEDFDPERLLPGLPRLPGMPGMRGLPDVELPEGVESAAIVGAVEPDSPAAQAGLQSGDIILAIDGAPVTDAQALVDAVGERAPGDAITLTLYRDGEELDVDVTLGAHPDDTDAAYLGVRVRGFIRIERSERPGGPFDFDFDLDFNDPGRNDA